MVFPAALNRCMIPRLDVAEKPQRILPNMPTDNLDVLFAVLPFAPVSQPALGISILKSAATEAGFSAAARYYAFDLAERVGFRSYNDVAAKWGSLPHIGDWIFAESLYGERLPPPQRFLAYLKTTYLAPAEEVPDAGLRRLGMTLSQYFVKHVWPGMLKARRLAPEFVEQWADEILALEPARGRIQMLISSVLLMSRRDAATEDESSASHHHRRRPRLPPGAGMALAPLLPLDRLCLHRRGRRSPSPIPPPDSAWRWRATHSRHLEPPRRRTFRSASCA